MILFRIKRTWMNYFVPLLSSGQDEVRLKYYNIPLFDSNKNYYFCGSWKWALSELNASNQNFWSCFFYCIFLAWSRFKDIPPYGGIYGQIYQNNNLQFGRTSTWSLHKQMRLHRSLGRNEESDLVWNVFTVPKLPFTFPNCYNPVAALHFTLTDITNSGPSYSHGVNDNR